MDNVSAKTKLITKIGILSAISVILVWLVHFPIIPQAGFLEYDPADVPIIIGTFAMGPVAGFLLTVIASVIQGLTVSAASSWYGILMHVLASGSYALVAGAIYRHKKTKKNAVFAMVMGTVTWVLVMIPANLFITPIYMGVERAAVVSLLPWIILFNVIKTVVNSTISFFVYKRVSPLLHK